MARGGRRAGAKGALYPNRTDLRSGPLPATAPRGLPYGERAQLIAAQRQVPMAPASAPGPGAPGAAPAQAAPPEAAPPQGPAPGTLPFTHPTQRPGEPVTAGIPLGAGPGPEVLGNLNAGRQNVAALLGQLAAVPGATSEVTQLAQYAASGRG